MAGDKQARTILWYLVFAGFAVNYTIRINLNITIVEMIKSSSSLPLSSSPLSLPSSPSSLTSQSSAPLSVDIKSDQNLDKWITVLQFNRSNSMQHDKLTDELFQGYENYDGHYSWERALLKYFKIPFASEGFNWNEYEQGLILGAFFWAHWITQIPGGILAKKYGTKLVFGLSNVVGCWLCLLIPLTAYLDYRLLICLRVVQGLITGLAWPAMHVLTANWIPPNERSKFVTAYLGSSVGIALFYPLFGYVMHWITWEWVYYICGILGTVWWLIWLLCVFDTPHQHPHITIKELNYIEKALGSSVQANNRNMMIPWKSILLSRPVWLNVIAQWGGIWGLFTLMTQAPTYFRVIHQWDIRATGILSGLPHLMRILFAYAFSLLADYLLKKGKITRTNLRKLATSFCCIVKGLMVLALAYFGYNSTAAIVLLTMATMFHGAVSSGPLASIVDIAPNYAGIVLGISGMIGVLPGFISPYVVGILTLGKQTLDSWKHVFLICSGMLIGSGLLYVCFSDSNLQTWNDYYCDNISHRELNLLTKSTEKKINGDNKSNFDKN